MNPLQRVDLGIEIDEVLVVGETEPSLFAGHDVSGQQYLVAEARHDAKSTTWLFAPISPLALRCIIDGRADPCDALRHSATGYVNRVTVTSDRLPAVEETVQLCRELGDDDLAMAHQVTTGRDRTPITRCA